MPIKQNRIRLKLEEIVEPCCYYQMISAEKAFNNSATASSTWTGKSNIRTQNFFPNGLDVCDNYAGPMAHTKYEANQWFKIDQGQSKVG